jgi:hypothetical protein
MTRAAECASARFAQEQPSSAPASVRHDRQRFAEWEARERGLIEDQDDDIDFERISEIGEEQYRRELQERRTREDNPAPHVFSFYFQTPQRPHDPRARVYQDPLEAECVDGGQIRGGNGGYGLDALGRSVRR